MNNQQCSFTIIKLVSRNIRDFTKVLSRNINFGTEFKKARKFIATKVWSYTVVSHSPQAIPLTINFSIRSVQ